MARIRSIHPALFTDEAFVSLSPEAQVLWIGLWCEADDQGVFEWKPTMLKMRILPASTSRIEPLLAQLEENNCIKAYSANDRQYGVIRNFVRHQRPKSPKEVHPLPPEYQKYAGFDVNGTRPDATTGRRRFGSNSKPDRRSEGSEFGTSSELDDADASVHSKLGPVSSERNSEPLRNEFGSSSECGSQMEDVGCSYPSREITFQDGERVTPSPTHTHTPARGAAPDFGDDALARRRLA